MSISRRINGADRRPESVCRGNECKAERCINNKAETNINASEAGSKKAAGGSNTGSNSDQFRREKGSGGNAERDIRQVQNRNDNLYAVYDRDGHPISLPPFAKKPVEKTPKEVEEFVQSVGESASVCARSSASYCHQPESSAAKDLS